MEAIQGMRKKYKNNKTTEGRQLRNQVNREVKKAKETRLEKQ